MVKASHTAIQWFSRVFLVGSSPWVVPLPLGAPTPMQYNMAPQQSTRWRATLNLDESDTKGLDLGGTRCDGTAGSMQLTMGSPATTHWGPLDKITKLGATELQFHDAFFTLVKITRVYCTLTGFKNQLGGHIELINLWRWKVRCLGGCVLHNMASLAST